MLNSESDKLDDSLDYITTVLNSESDKLDDSFAAIIIKYKSDKITFYLKIGRLKIYNWKWIVKH